MLHAEVNSIYKEYQLKKGKFRKLFNTRSKLMDFVAYHLHSNTQPEIAEFVLGIFKNLPFIETRLSYGYAIKIIAICFNNNDRNIFNALKFLHNLKSISAELIIAIKEHEDSSAAARAFLAFNKPDISIKEKQEIQKIIKEESAHYCLAYVFHKEKNIEQALKCYIKSFALGSQAALNIIKKIQETEPKASFQLAELYQNGLWDFKINLPLAIDNYRKAFIKGIVEAGYRIGNIYETGGVNLTVDLSQACKYYDKSMQQNHVAAKARLEFLANEENDKFAQFILGNFAFKKNNKDEAIKLWLQSSEQCYEPANEAILNTKFTSDLCKEIARRYETGDGVKVNIKRAIIFYEKAANSGSAEANYILAKWYELGENDIEIDLEKSYQYFYKAASKKHPEALAKLMFLADKGNDRRVQYLLGKLAYEENNFEKAIQWWLQSSEQCYEPANEAILNTKFTSDLCKEIARRYETGDGVKLNIKRAIIFYEKAKEQNDIEAILYLGQLYQFGYLGVVPNIDLACQCYLQASRNGENLAKEYLQLLFEEASSSMQKEIINLHPAIKKPHVQHTSLVRKSIKQKPKKA